jgi:hypothetical protein
MDMNAETATESAIERIAPISGQIWDESASEPATPKSPALRAYEARRCHICRCQHPSFGFGPPLTRPGGEIWACAKHHETVGQMLTEGRRPKPVDQQPTLL